MQIQPKPRIRVGQRYLESGKDWTPSMVRLIVTSVEPLEVQPEKWTGRLERRPYQAEALLALPLVEDPDLEPGEVVEALLGEVVSGVEYDHDGGLAITLSNGRTVSVAGVWHNDSTAGTAVKVYPPL